MRFESTSVLSVAVFLVTACKTTSSATGVGDAGANAVDAAHAPAHHRASASTCSSVATPAEPPAADAGAACHTHADCTARPNGRCVPRIGGGPSLMDGNHCLYDECTSDDTCATGEVCACAKDDATLCSSPGYCNCNPKAAACVLQARSDDSVCTCGEANACVKGSCRVDADCGSGGFCSPATDVCGHFFGYACHTPEDACVDDADCASITVGAPLCTPEAATSGGTGTRWVCSAVGGCP